MPVSMQQRLKQGVISLDAALAQMVTSEGNLQSSLLDHQLCKDCIRKIRALPAPIVPLLLWQDCYYLATPVNIQSGQVDVLRHQLQTQVEIIKIG